MSCALAKHVLPKWAEDGAEKASELFLARDSESNLESTYPRYYIFTIPLMNH